MTAYALIQPFLAGLVSGFGGLAIRMVILRARRITYRQHDFDLVDKMRGLEQKGTTRARTMLTFYNASGGPGWLLGGHDIRPKDIYSPIAMEVSGDAEIESVEILERRPKVVDAKESRRGPHRAVVKNFHLNRGDKFTVALILKRPRISIGWRRLLYGRSVCVSVSYGISGMKGPRQIGTLSAKSFWRPLFLFVGALILLVPLSVLYYELVLVRQETSLRALLILIYWLVYWSVFITSFLLPEVYSSIVEFFERRRLQAKIKDDEQLSGRRIAPDPCTEPRAWRAVEAVMYMLVGVLVVLLAVGYFSLL